MAAVAAAPPATTQAGKPEMESVRLQHHIKAVWPPAGLGLKAQSRPLHMLLQQASPVSINISRFIYCVGAATKAGAGSSNALRLQRHYL
jgi:hypothetical protein